MNYFEVHSFHPAAIQTYQRDDCGGVVLPKARRVLDASHGAADLIVKEKGRLRRYSRCANRYKLIYSEQNTPFIAEIIDLALTPELASIIRLL